MSKTKIQANQLDMFPPRTKWVKPDLPDWRGTELALDSETKDDGLNTDFGPGWINNNGHILGVSASIGENSIYLPISHPDTDNFDTVQIARWVTDHIKAAPKLSFHSADYDIGWLGTIGVPPPPSYDDIHAMAVMIDENRNEYSLNALCNWQKVQGKDESLLKDAAASFGVMDIKSGLWRLPAKFVGPYAEQDAKSTFEVAQKLRPQIKTQGLTEAYKLELDLIPICMAMRKRGIRIDEEKLEKLQYKFNRERDECLRSITRELVQRREVTIDDIHSPDWLEMAFDKLGIWYPRTPKLKRGQFQSEWLEAHDHPIAKAIALARTWHDASSKFLGQYIKDKLQRGRIHAEIHRLRDDSGGTRSYRFSYSNPPLQQMPADERIGALIRSIFLPEVGEEWLSTDYSGQEPRLTVHYAHKYKCFGADKAVAAYLEDPRLDYHQFVADLTGLPRKKAKIINLGLAYGMGIEKLCGGLGVSYDDGIKILSRYNDKMPFIRQLSIILANEASGLGYITLIDGARCRFDKWERNKFGNSVRAFTHKAMNREIQGSAARQTKRAMKNLYLNGILPLIQMHDELAFSIKERGVIPEVEKIMCEAIPLAIPVCVDSEVGANWGML